MNLSIKKYKKGDEYKIIQLFSKVFNKKMNLEYWTWRYDKSNKKYIYLMWDDEILAGHYAVFPIKIKYIDDYIESGFSMTTMTSNAYKKMGIFKELSNSLYLDSYNELKIMWGFPNNNSLHGFKKYLKWSNLFDINILTIDIQKIQSKLINNSYIFTVDKFTSDYNKLFTEVSNKYDFIVKRDSNYLNWRFIENPVNKYYILEYREDNVLRGYSVYKIFNENNILYGDIVDFLAVDSYVFKELMLNTLLSIKESKINFANLWVTDFDYKKILYDIGFYDGELKTHFGILNNGKIKISTDVKKYYLTMSDSDVF